MKKLIMLVLAFLLMTALTLTLAACAEKPAEELTNNNQPMDTPHRIGTQGTTHGSIGYSPTLEELINDAELIVDITITEWLGENTERGTTFFLAKVNDTFKGENFYEIEIIQSGNSLFTLSRHPLFQVEDRVLVFLNIRERGESSSLSQEEWDEIYLGRYYIASYIDVMDIWEHENELFLLNRADFTPLAESIILSKEIEGVDEETRDIIAAQYLEYDPIFEYALYENVHENIFVLESVTDKITRIVNENNN
jgi:hypothetical protein